MTFEEIQTALPSLPTESLKKIHSIVCTLIALRGEPEEKEKPIYTLFVKVLIDCIRSYKSLTTPTVERDILTKGRALLPKVEMEVNSFIKEYFEGIKRHQQAKLYFLLCHIAITKLHRRNKKHDVGFGEILVELQSPKGLFDRAFPGYINAGLQTAVFLNMSGADEPKKIFEKLHTGEHNDSPRGKAGKGSKPAKG